ncbi:MAG: 50S ribosomal protein L10 [Bacillales bacterium]
MNKEVLKQKTAIVQEVTDSVKESNAFVICEYKGLTVKEISGLRKTLREKDARAVVYKNTLVSRALSAEYKDLEELFTGSNMYFFLKDGTNGSLAAIAKFAKKHEGLSIKGGTIDGKVVSKEYITEVANLPSKEGLVSMLLSVLQAPMRNLAYSLSEVSKGK